MKRFVLYIILGIFPVLLSGQEYLTATAGNPVVESRSGEVSYKSYFLRYAAVKLPFFDNFSEITVYPDSSRWIDNEAYINADYPYYPVDYGVATLDVVDAYGRVYENASPFTFVADHLTSKPIRLDVLYDDNGDSVKALTPADSVHLSFYYQPQGRGDMPLNTDSLVLEFGYFPYDTIIDSIFGLDTTIVLKKDYDTVFSHFDSVWVYGYEYDMSAYGGEYYPPNVILLPPLGCDDLEYVLQDTFFITDSLLIPCDSVFVLDSDWELVWTAKGDTLTDFLEENDTYFKHVRIPITDEKWFRDDFQFRFVTYSTISSINSWQSNTDHWHLDRVRLDANRYIGDEYVREISFPEDMPSLVNEYTAITARQYLGNVYDLKKDEFPVYINNLDSVDHSLTYDYYVEKPDGTVSEVFDIDPINESMVPYFQQDVETFMPFTTAPIKGAFTSVQKNQVYTVHHFARDPEMPDAADTIISYQEFSDYLAYDDGTAEAGYGLAPAQAKLAVKSRSEMKDTLWGIRLYFNKTFANNNNRLFSVVVWNDNGGIPGDTLLFDDNIRPQFTEGLNHFYDLPFYRYVILGRQNFFVGWEQNTNNNLNIGFDRNTNSRSKNFFNVEGKWVNSSFEGSIMIRPLIGTPQVEYDNQAENKNQNKNLVIRPNPPLQQHEVYIDLPGGYNDPKLMELLTLKVSDLTGRVLYSGPYTNRISTAGFQYGLYIVTLFDEAFDRRYSAKLIIVK